MPRAVLAMLVLGLLTGSTVHGQVASVRMSVAELLPDVALGVYRPAFPDKLAAVDEYERASGARMSIIHWFALWGGWKSAFNAADLEKVRQRGSIPMISWEPWAARPRDPEWSLREAILSGRNDEYIESWARGLAAYGGPVLLRWAHEMHHQKYPWAVNVNGNTADEYVAAWRYVHGFFTRAGAANVQWVWNPNTLAGAPAAKHEALYRKLYPGDAFVDWIGIDIYNTGPGLDWGRPGWHSFAELLREPYAAVTAIADKPIIIPETGSAENGGSKSAWIAEALSDETLAQFPRLRAVVWYDIQKEEQWQLSSSAQALEAWLQAAARPAFAARGQAR